jgi:hypothetical protein
VDADGGLVIGRDDSFQSQVDELQDSRKRQD